MNTTQEVTGNVTFIGDPVWPAVYDPEDRWNGFIANPRFTRETAEDIVRDLQANDVDYEWEWDGDVIVMHYGDITERFGPDEDGLYAAWSSGYAWMEA